MTTKLEPQINTQICDTCGKEKTRTRNLFYDMFEKFHPEKKNDNEEFIYECNHCVEEYDRKMEEKQRLDEENRKRENLISGIPLIYHGSSISDFNGIEKIINWIKQHRGFLFIHGGTGTGKTHLLCSIKKKYNELEKYSYLYFSSDIFMRIRKSFNGGEETEAAIIKNCTTPILTMFESFVAP